MSETLKMLPVKLDAIEREQRAKELADILLEVEHEAAIEAGRDRIKALKSECAEASAKRREALKEAAEEFDNALAAHKTGFERRLVDVERHAIIATQMMEVVRLDTGEVVESRPMTSQEQAKWCRQGTIDDVTGGATVKAGVVEGEAPAEDAAASDVDGDEDAEAPGESDRLDEGEAEALGLPVGWPRAWRGKTWKVKDETLEEGDVLEVYLRLTAAGTKIADLLAGTEGVQGLEAMGMSRGKVGRALSLLRTKGLADRGEGQGVWVLVDWRAASAEREEEPEPGRADPLPEAADAPKPKRQGKAQTKADRLVNAAAEQSDGWAL